jgi:hypothetical protein
MEIDGAADDNVGSIGADVVPEIFLPIFIPRSSMAMREREMSRIIVDLAMWLFVPRKVDGEQINLICLTLCDRCVFGTVCSIWT